MASISTDPAGFKRLVFTNSAGQRKAIHLGRIPDRDADVIKGHVEQILIAIKNNTVPHRKTAEWLAQLGDDLAGKLQAVGLIVATKQQEAVTLAAFLDSYIAKRADGKKNSVSNLRIAANRLKAFFPESTPLASITPGMADDWILYLQREKYARATIGRSIKYSKQFFRAAVRAKLIAENPCDGIKPPGEANEARRFFVSRELAQRVLDACPDTEWKLLFALSRWGGLRCPSEHLNLKWAEVDWERGRFLVHAPKTEHHEDGGDRWVPIFPELRPHLEAAFEQADPGAVYVIGRHRDTNINLRTQLFRIIVRAGEKPWPKPFQNCRATRETELAAEYPIHVVCAWIGNTERIASKHYLQVTDDYFVQAAKPTTPSKPTRIPTRRESAGPRQTPPADEDDSTDGGVGRSVAPIGGVRQRSVVRPEGFEPPTYGSEDHCSIQLSYGRKSLNCKYLMNNSHSASFHDYYLYYYLPAGTIPGKDTRPLQPSGYRTPTEPFAQESMYA
jgi:integrase